MVIAAPEPQALQKAVGEQRVVFRDISWDDYLVIVETLPYSRNAHLTYDNGTLEITVPLEDHEFYRSL
ncbi:MAG: Uma2 family endonuclease, partial [Limnothrix sp. RL_2_0]|nr:Uma2 family endonuclease [Limnothrix sp. RL_2_0]